QRARGRGRGGQRREWGQRVLQAIGHNQAGEAQVLDAPGFVGPVPARGRLGGDDAEAERATHDRVPAGRRAGRLAGPPGRCLAAGPGRGWRGTLRGRSPTNRTRRRPPAAIGAATRKTADSPWATAWATPARAATDKPWTTAGLAWSDPGLRRPRRSAGTRRGNQAENW